MGRNTFQVSENTAYLFRQLGIELSAEPPAVEILVRHSRSLRATVRHWWDQLEPEVTAGLPGDDMEKTLCALAREAAGRDDHEVSLRWARSRFSWKPDFLHSTAQRVMGERFLDAFQRLGLVQRTKDRVFFGHPLLLAFYRGLDAARRASEWRRKDAEERTDGASRDAPRLTTPDGQLLPPLPEPPEVRERNDYQEARATPLADDMDRLATGPLDTIDGRAALVSLVVADPDHREARLRVVAARNLVLPTWYLYHDPEARERHGVWLAGQILDAADWDSVGAVDQLARLATSLGESAVGAARELLDQDGAILPPYLPAIGVLGQPDGRPGLDDDIQRLRRLASDDDLGQWEIEELRRILGEASAAMTEDGAREQFEKEEKWDVLRKGAGFALKLVGTVAHLASPAPGGRGIGRQIQHDLMTQGADRAGDQLLENKGSEFFRGQKELRTLVAGLPIVIEERKTRVAELAPRIRRAAHEAAERLVQAARRP